ncbi:leafy protein [Prunus yedoensis var. nudiflora]|uniref:Floricaula/leafy-like transcription factor n=1 Tax=Prunus yedoensis var. nudiflora TaxID=2094558 RepID=A0A314ZE68_PRUYE|nr:leafy protein [Prunus yedoensis var. nudiflora]
MDDMNGHGNGGGGRLLSERQREHPFIVTEPGEVARGKKNGLDYLFHLYEQCRDFLIQVQTIAKEHGEKCPTKVTNQVFRFAKKAGASYINKPKMRHYVHCYALHCLDEEASNALRRVFKERGENVGAWRHACYKPLVTIAAGQGWDIDAIFNSHPRLSIWYVPTKLRQLCHTERNNATASSSASGGGVDHLPY